MMVEAQNQLAKMKNFEGFNMIKSKNPELFSLHRLIILSGIYLGDFVGFQELKELTQISSAGNLASHLRALENQGLIKYHGGKAGRRTIALYSLTPQGKEEFEDVAFGLRQFLPSYRK